MELLDTHPLDIRKRKGRAILETRNCDGALDDEHAGRDAVSDLLTELFGPSGAYRYDRNAVRGLPTPIVDDEAREKALRFLARCFDTYVGDAEDYMVAAE